MNERSFKLTTGDFLKICLQFYSCTWIYSMLHCKSVLTNSEYMKFFNKWDDLLIRLINVIKTYQSSMLPKILIFKSYRWRHSIKSTNCGNHFHLLINMAIGSVIACCFVEREKKVCVLRCLHQFSGVFCVQH